MNPITVTTGHVSTRVCRRGSPATHVIQRSKARLVGAAAVEEVPQPLGERACADLRLDRIAQRHLLEREEQVRPRLDARRPPRDLDVPARAQQLAQFLAPQLRLPPLVRLPLVVALPVEIRLVPEPAGKIAEELLPALEDRVRVRSASMEELFRNDLRGGHDKFHANRAPHTN